MRPPLATVVGSSQDWTTVTIRSVTNYVLHVQHTPRGWHKDGLLDHLGDSGDQTSCPKLYTINPKPDQSVGDGKASLHVQHRIHQQD